MSLLTTSAASIHQLGAAVAFNGAPRPPGPSAGGRAGARGLWSRYDVAANMMLAGGWMIEQRTLRKHHIDQATDDAVKVKDLAVIGAALTNIAGVAVSQLVKREFPQGLPLDVEGHLTADASTRGKRYHEYITALRMLNRAFAAGAIGFTPRVNFNILRSYRPGTIFRLFT